MALIKRGLVVCIDNSEQAQNINLKQDDTRNGVYRKAESCLYNYKAKCAALDSLNLKLKELNKSASVHAQSYESNINGHNIGDPVAQRAAKIFETENKIAKLELETIPVTRLIQDLNSSEVLNASPNAEQRDILKLFYFGKNSLDTVVKELNISRRRFYYARDKLVWLAAEYLGLL